MYPQCIVLVCNIVVGVDDANGVGSVSACVPVLVF